MQAYNGPDVVPPPNVAVIGLGTGTLASYARPGQTMTFYDIDPVVRDISYDSEDYFTFVKDAKRRGAEVPLVLGDARLTLDRQQLDESQKYRILAIDAFSSDAIPMHLINREALQMFLGKVTKDGIICHHISNRYLDLEPVLGNLCQDAGLVGYVMSDDDESSDTPGKTASTWVAIARTEQDLSRLMTEDRWEHERPGIEEQLRLAACFPDGGTGLAKLAAVVGAAVPHVSAPWKPLRTDKSVGVWTDDYSNIVSVFLR
jgi:hypothetical protein